MNKKDEQRISRVERICFDNASDLLGLKPRIRETRESIEKIEQVLKAAVIILAGILLFFSMYGIKCAVIALK